MLPGRAAIIAEHKPYVLAALCPAAALLDQGRKVKEAPPAELFDGAAFNAIVSVIEGDVRGNRHAEARHRGRGDRGPRRRPALAADRASAVIDCKATADKFVYDCIIKLSNARTAAPLEQAAVTVGADMPSMPMAHNVRPVIAKATGTPGEYQARLTLEMHGDWAVRLRISGPLRDQLVQMQELRRDGLRPTPPQGRRTRRGGGHKH